MGFLFSDQDVYPDGYWLNRDIPTPSISHEKINLSEYRYFDDESLFDGRSMTLRELAKHIELCSEEDMDLEVRIFNGYGEHLPTTSTNGLDIELVCNSTNTIPVERDINTRRCILLMRGNEP